MDELTNKRINMLKVLRLPTNTKNTIQDCRNIEINGKIGTYLFEMQAKNPNELIEFCKQIKECQEQFLKFNILTKAEFIVSSNLYNETENEIKYWKSFREKNGL
jgi:hypothetical protein